MKQLTYLGVKKAPQETGD